jgi:hypothetical protein
MFLLENISGGVHRPTVKLYNLFNHVAALSDIRSWKISVALAKQVLATP